MKKSWEYKTIKEIGTVIGGTTPSTNNKEYWDGEHCWISPAELDGSHYLYDSVRKVTDKAVKDKNLKLLPIGTVILSSRAPIGKVTINKIPTYCNQGFKCVICGNRVYNEFLYWWFWGKTEYLNSIGTGATFKEISKKVVENIIIPVPPLSEQKEIVEYLDSSFAKIDKLKANAAKNLEEAKALFQSALKDALEPKEGWEEKTLKELTNKIGSGATPKGGRKVYIDEGCSLIRSMNVLYNIFKYDELAHINEEAADQLKGVEVQKNDVLFNITGASIARCCIVPEDILPARVNQHVSILRLKADVLPIFLCYTLISPTNQRKLLKIGEAGSTRQALTKSDLENHMIGVPSLQEQQSIVFLLDSLNEKVNTLQQNYSRICSECDALKQAILRQVFE